MVVAVEFVPGAFHFATRVIFVDFDVGVEVALVGFVGVAVDVPDSRLVGF